MATIHGKSANKLFSLFIREGEIRLTNHFPIWGVLFLPRKFYPELSRATNLVITKTKKKQAPFIISGPWPQYMENQPINCFRCSFVRGKFA